jgi:Fe-S-cluster containining protein
VSLVEKIFSCTRCGFCCQGETTVSLDLEDQQRMVAYLQMPMAEVREKFWRITGAQVQMKTIDGHCIFYKDGCSVHPGRPKRCGQWPLHPAILGDEGNYAIISDSCPGINKQLSYREFCKILQTVLESEGEKRW